MFHARELSACSGEGAPSPAAPTRTAAARSSSVGLLLPRPSPYRTRRLLPAGPAPPAVFACRVHGAAGSWWTSTSASANHVRSKATSFPRGLLSSLRRSSSRPLAASRLGGGRRRTRDGNGKEAAYLGAARGIGRRRTRRGGGGSRGAPVRTGRRESREKQQKKRPLRFGGGVGRPRDLPAQLRILDARGSVTGCRRRPSRSLHPLKLPVQGGFQATVAVSLRGALWIIHHIIYFEFF
jgi:hypothetical protein